MIPGLGRSEVVMIYPDVYSNIIKKTLPPLEPGGITTAAPPSLWRATWDPTSRLNLREDSLPLIINQ